MQHEKYMREALALAALAAELGEIPVGCVIVHKGAVIARGFNTRERDQNALLHAEVAAINEACAHLKRWRLDDCAIYVTLEPCPMCAGAIMNARIGEVCYGAGDTRFGACGGVLNLFEEAFGFKPRLRGGILRDECAALLSDFFDQLRSRSDDGHVQN